MTPIYHITHVDNLAGIIQAGRLWSDKQRIGQGITVTNIGYSHIKQRRLTRGVTAAAMGTLGDYVPFNFCHRSVMLYVISRGHQDYSGGHVPIVHLVSSVETAMASGRPWAFTDRHAELGHAQYFDNWNSKSQIDWTVMQQTQWGGDAEVKERRQAEFLVYDWFPWTAVERIGVLNTHMATKVKSILAAATHQPLVSVEPSWYY